MIPAITVTTEMIIKKYLEKCVIFDSKIMGLCSEKEAPANIKYTTITNSIDINTANTQLVIIKTFF